MLRVAAVLVLAVLAACAAGALAQDPSSSPPQPSGSEPEGPKRPACRCVYNATSVFLEGQSYKEDCKNCTCVCDCPHKTDPGHGCFVCADAGCAHGSLLGLVLLVGLCGCCVCTVCCACGALYRKKQLQKRREQGMYVVWAPPQSDAETIYLEQ
jgi:hypothetical protein